MKAERRHDLKTNALDRALQQVPELWEEYGRQVLLIGILAVLVAIFLYMRWGGAHQAALALQDDLAGAQSAIRDLRDPEAFLAGVTQPSEAQDQMLKRAGDASAVLDRVLKTDNRVAASEAAVSKGDLAWALANLPDFASLPAATQPTTQASALLNPTAAAPKLDRAASLQQAQQAYEEVLSKYADQPRAVVEARFGLAAVAENRKEWDNASKLYQQILDDPRADSSLKMLAARRKDDLAQIQQPIWIGVPATMPAVAVEPTTAAPQATPAPTTQESPQQSAAMPTTAPSAQ